MAGAAYFHKPLRPVPGNSAYLKNAGRGPHFSDMYWPVFKI